MPLPVILNKGDGVASPHLFRAYGFNPAHPLGHLGVSRPRGEGLTHLLGMDAMPTPGTDPGRPQLHLIEQVLSLTELCHHLR